MTPSRRFSLACMSMLAPALWLSACAGPARPSAPASPAVLEPGSPRTVLSSEPWIFNGEPGRVLRTGSYRIYTTETDPYLLDRLPAFLEAALEQYRTALGPLPAPPLTLDTFLMASRPQWSALTLQVMGDQAAPYLRIQRGGFAAGGRAMLWTIGRHDTLAIAAHEGWHQYTQRTFRQWLPVWLEEGIATFMEGFVSDPIDPDRPVFHGWANVERFDQLRAAGLRGEILALEELLAIQPQDLIARSSEGTLTYYAQVWALVHFLREGDGGRHREALQTLVSDAAEGRLQRALEIGMGAPEAARALDERRGSAVFRAYFGPDISPVSGRYAEYVSRIVTEGSRERIVAGRSPLQ